MKELNKNAIIIVVIIMVCVGVFFGYEYVTEPKIVNGALSKSINEKGKPIQITSNFSHEATVYFSAKRNRFWVNKAKVVWYKGEIAIENRLLVDEEVIVNEGKYFTSQLSVPDGLEEGLYSVTIYVDGKDIRETSAQFEVKR